MKWCNYIDQKVYILIKANNTLNWYSCQVYCFVKINSVNLVGKKINFLTPRNYLLSLMYFSYLLFPSFDKLFPVFFRLNWFPDACIPYLVNKKYLFCCKIVWWLHRSDIAGPKKTFLNTNDLMVPNFAALMAHHLKITDLSGSTYSTIISKILFLWEIWVIENDA